MTQLWDFLAKSKEPLAAAQSIATILALIIGGLGAYFKIFKGRIYTRRLEPSISASILSGEGYKCAAVKISIKNVGQARVDLDLRDSTVSARYYIKSNYEQWFHNAFWSDLGTTNAITRHEWVDPGEIVTEERLFALPYNTDVIAVEFQLRLLSRPPRYAFWRPRTEWNASTVVNAAESPVPKHAPPAASESPVAAK
jgi:hypothetical protein